MSVCSYVIGRENNTEWTYFYNQLYAKQHKIEKVLANDPPKYTPPCIMSIPSVERDKYMSLWSTYGTVWKKALEECGEDYISVYENDAIFPSTYAKNLSDVVRAAETSKLRVVWLDKRSGTHKGAGGCCTVGVMYHRTILADLIRQFDLNRSDASYWAEYAQKPRKVVNDTVCLTDFYLGNVVAYQNWNAYSYGIIHHPSERRKYLSRWVDRWIYQKKLENLSIFGTMPRAYH